MSGRKLDLVGRYQLWGIESTLLENWKIKYLLKYKYSRKKIITNKTEYLCKIGFVNYNQIDLKVSPIIYLRKYNTII